MFRNTFNKLLIGIMMLSFTTFPHVASAGGIVLGGTRLVYPIDAKQTTLSVRNSSSETSYLVQSWTEDAQGKKSMDFIVTPPLYVSNPGDQNILRVMYSGPPLPLDRETLFYFNAKAIPSIDKFQREGKNLLMLAAVTRIKIFVRPKGLSIPVNKASSLLKFKRSGNELRVNNPSPYHITLVKVSLDGRPVTDTMVGPFSTESLPLSGNPRTLTYSTIDDYGSVSAQQHHNL